jgi:hypothetical protein
MDLMIIEFVGKNWLTIFLSLQLLKGIAVITPTVKDDKIVTLLFTMYNALKSGKTPDKLVDDLSKE